MLSTKQTSAAISDSDLRGKNVYIGLSGGVDSAVSAALLLRAGAMVHGVYIKGWYPPEMPCTWAADRRDAMRVAAHLHIPFTTLDARKEYKEGVIDYLLSEYRAGRTPNPDVMCNREVKFGAFYTFAKAQGADFIATGHYRSGKKNQSYFLWAVPNTVLKETVFPVGHLEKNVVRSLAKKLHLPVAEKRDSQGVCFLGSVSVEEFLKKEFGIHPGKAFDEEGKEVGAHEGVLLSTLGERVALQGGVPGPWYVLRKDIEKNQLFVGRDRLLCDVEGKHAIHVTHINWHGDASNVTCAQYRYRGPIIPGRVQGETFIPKEALREPVAAGQSLVFFSDQELVGGGIIAA